MNTLQEIASFVGQGRVTLRSMTDLVPLLTPAGRNSMQQMILELANLPPVTLEASIDMNQGQVPFQPHITISATSGAVSATTIDLHRSTDGAVVSQFRLPSPAAGGTFGEVQIGNNGAFVYEVVRTGVQSTGSVTLRKDFSVLVTEPPPPPQPQVKPSIAVTSNGDGSFTLSGFHFTKKAAVHIRVVDPVHANDQSLLTNADASGNVTDFKTPKLCVNPGPIFFSANDGRSDPSDLTGTLWSNTVSMTCS